MKKLSLSSFLICALSFSWAQNFIPTQEPLLKLSRPKHNIFAMFDDSASIAQTDVYVSEHFESFGKPACIRPNNWNQILDSPQYATGKYYDPFKQGKYIPYNPEEHIGEGFDGSIYIEECQQMNRSAAFKILLEQFITQFHKDYFLGFGGLGKNNTATLAWYANYNKQYPLIINEVEDLSIKTSNQWPNIYEKINALFDPDAVSESWSPIFPALYNISLYFRGYPIPLSSDGEALGYQYQNLKSPLQYRCAKNNIILFTDGRPNRSYIDVFANKDIYSNATLKFGSNLKIAETKEYDNGKLITKQTYPTLLAQDLITSNYYNYLAHLGYVQDGYTGSEDGKQYDDRYNYIDSNRYAKAKYQIPSNIFQDLIAQNLLDGYGANKPAQDKAGQDWTGPNSIDQVLNVNAIIFSETPTSEFTSLLKSTNGNYIQQTNIDLSSTFENVQKLFEKSNSFTSYTNGFSIEDQYMRTNNTIRYVFYHNYYSNSGNIRAYTLKTDTEWNTTPEWTTDQRTHAGDGRFLTMSYSTSSFPKANDLTSDAISTVFKSTYDINQLHPDYIHWLRGISNLNSTSNINLRPRISPIGPIVNGKPEFFSKDKEYINLNFVSDTQKIKFEDYVKFKSKHMNTEFLITGANDGLIHFIQTNRKNDLMLNQGGMRKAAYFPGYLAARLLDITQTSKPFSFTMDGQTNVFEFINKNGDFTSIGITGMGAGGKGIVGYQLFKMINNKQAEDSIQPLFEIVNENNFAYNTPGFANMGYTYSGFEFFNQGNINKPNTGTGIAVFGNGFGNKVSSLYFIDIENGRLLKEIILNPNGGGAATPALSLLKNDTTGLQQLNYLVVGDQSGRLYRINFSGNDITTATVTSEILYEPDIPFKQPISTRPMLYRTDNNSPTWVYFGTGRKADENLDRGIKSKEQQYFIGFPVNTKPNLQQLYEVKYSVKNNIIKLADEDSQDPENKAQSGWYLKLTPSSTKINGNRLAYQPGTTAYGDVVFSTWELAEGSDIDFCSEDIGTGFQIALNAGTAQKGLFTSNNQSIAGIKVNGTAPGIPSGTSISYLGLLTGAIDHGTISTMSKEAIDELNSFHTLTSHTINDRYLKRCLATTNGELDIKIPEFCHNIEDKTLIKRRLSIQKLY